AGGSTSQESTGVQQPWGNPPDIALPLALHARLSTVTGPPRLTQPTSWWLQVMGRLKPGVTAAQVQGNVEGVFRHTARAGLDSYLKSLPEKDRTTSVNQNRTEVPHLLVEPGGGGAYAVFTDDLRSVTIL